MTTVWENIWEAFKFACGIGFVLSIVLFFIASSFTIYDELLVKQTFYIGRNVNCDGINISDMQHLTTKGYSMLPTLTPNSTYIYIEATNKTIYNAGDMVVYEVNGSRRLHRIVGVYPDKIITKGDNNKYVDEAINESQIKEVVCGIIYGGII